MKEIKQRDNLIETYQTIQEAHRKQFPYYRTKSTKTGILSEGTYRIRKALIRGSRTIELRYSYRRGWRRRYTKECVVVIIQKPINKVKVRNPAKTILKNKMKLNYLQLNKQTAFGRPRKIYEKRLVADDADRDVIIRINQVFLSKHCRSLHNFQFTQHFF